MGHKVSGYPEGRYILQILQMVEKKKPFRLSYAGAGHIAFLLMHTANDAVLIDMLSGSQAMPYVD